MLNHKTHFFNSTRRRSHLLALAFVGSSGIKNVFAFLISEQHKDLKVLRSVPILPSRRQEGNWSFFCGGRKGFWSVVLGEFLLLCGWRKFCEGYGEICLGTGELMIRDKKEE
jgi:hypothetical protein